MKTFHRILVLAFLLMAATRPGALAQAAPSNELWVQIRYFDKGPAQPAVDCYGLIHKMDFDMVMGSDKTPNAVLKVTHVSWMNDGQIFQLSDTNINGAKLGLKNVMYIRADSIVRVVELDDAFVTQRLIPLKE